MKRPGRGSRPRLVAQSGVEDMDDPELSGRVSRFQIC